MGYHPMEDCVGAFTLLIDKEGESRWIRPLFTLFNNAASLPHYFCWQTNGVSPTRLLVVR